MRLVLKIILSSLLLWAGQAFAQLQLSLTQGVRGAAPVAVADFTGNKAAAKVISQLLRQDLNNSGRFAAERFTAAFSQASLRAAKMNYAISGSANCIANSCSVAVSLDNVFSNAHSHLLALNYTVSQSDLKALAHSISDAIYKQLTGYRGIFSTRIAYVLVQKTAKLPYYNLIVADYDGSNPHVLLHSLWPIMSPAWSPDGTNIAYVSFEGNRAAIYLQNLSSGTRSKLLAAPGINGAPAFSPDGSKIALVESVSGSPKIYLYDLKNKALKQLTTGYAIDTEPYFAPSGAGLVFTSNRGGTPQIYYYNFSDSKVKRITYTGSYNAHAEYLPDSKSIVYMHRTDDGWVVAMQNLQTGNVTNLTDSSFAESPSLAPNGQMLIYATRYGRREGLAEVSIDAKVQIHLPTADGSVREPAWSPFLT